MPIIDIHTHNLDTENGILSHSLIDGNIPLIPRYISLSIHPWYITADNLQIQIDNLCTAINDKRIMAIGECGLDKLCEVPFKLQIEAFTRIALIASEKKIPLIIHCVKAYNEIIQIKRKIKPGNAWIIHGFRGKKEIALQLLSHGILLSFGEKFNIESLRVTPIESMFFETDESKDSINDIIKRASNALLITPEELNKKVESNICRIFR